MARAKDSHGKPRRYYRYRVEEVWGSMIGRLEVGALTFDYWHGKSHPYTIMDLRKGEETGGYFVRSEGECSPDDYAKLDGMPA